MRSPNTIYFGLRGDFDPDDVARDIDLSPTEAVAKHARSPARRIPRCALMRYAQTYADPGEPVLDLDKLADEVVSKLEPYTAQFAKAIHEHRATATLQVVFEFPVSDEESTPVLGFSNRVARFVAATGARIDVDSYRA